MASPHLLLHPHWVIINTLKTVCEHSYQETNHFGTQPTQNTLTWTQEKALGEAEVPENTDKESDCNCIQVHPILQVSCLSRDVRSSPLGGAHNLISNRGQTLSHHPHYWFNMTFPCFAFFTHTVGAGIHLVDGCSRKSGDLYSKMLASPYNFKQSPCPLRFALFVSWGFFTTRVHKTERSKRSNTTKELVIDMVVLLVEERCRTTSWQEAAGRQGSSTPWILAREPGRKREPAWNSDERVRLKKWCFWKTVTLDAGTHFIVFLSSKSDL